MLTDESNVTKISVVVAIVSSVIAYFFSAKIAISIIVGQLSFQFYYQLLTIYYKVASASEEIRLRKKAFVAFVSKLLRIIVLAIPYLLAGFYPDRLSFLAIFYGQMIFKVILMMDAIVQVVNNMHRKEKD